MGSRESFSTVNKLEPWFDGGFKITKVVDAMGNDLDYTINKTMMRRPSSPLRPGEKMIFNRWWYNINDRMQIRKIGYEYFPEEDNYLYTIAQFYPSLRFTAIMRDGKTSNS